MPRMRSPQELLRDSRRELLSRSPRSSSPLERSEPIALMERGRTCGLFFRPLRNRPRSNRPRRNSHSLRQPPSPRATARTLPSPQQPPRRPMKLASIPHAAAALWHRLARIAPYAFSFRRMHAISPLPGNVCPKCMLFEIGMARSSPYASISRCNRVVLDTWRKDLARKVPFSRRETRNHAWHEDAAKASWPSKRAKNRIPQTGILSMSSSVLFSACPTPCNLCTRQGNLRFPAWKNCTERANLRFPVWRNRTKRTSLRFPIWGGLHKWVHRRCRLSMRFPVWRNCTRRTSLRFPTWKNYTRRTNLRFPTWITAPDRVSGATL